MSGEGCTRPSFGSNDDVDKLADDHDELLSLGVTDSLDHMTFDDFRGTSELTDYDVALNNSEPFCPLNSAAKRKPETSGCPVVIVTERLVSLTIIDSGRVKQTQDFEGDTGQKGMNNTSTDNSVPDVSDTALRDEEHTATDSTALQNTLNEQHAVDSDEGGTQAETEETAGQEEMINSSTDISMTDSSNADFQGEEYTTTTNTSVLQISSNELDEIDSGEEGNQGCNEVNAEYEEMNNTSTDISSADASNAALHDEEHWNTSSSILPFPSAELPAFHSDEGGVQDENENAGQEEMNIASMDLDWIDVSNAVAEFDELLIAAYSSQQITLSEQYSFDSDVDLTQIEMMDVRHDEEMNNISVDIYMTDASDEVLPAEELPTTSSAVFQITQAEMRKKLRRRDSEALAASIDRSRFGNNGNGKHKLTEKKEYDPRPTKRAKERSVSPVREKEKREFELISCSPQKLVVRLKKPEMEHGPPSVMDASNPGQTIEKQKDKEREASSLDGTIDGANDSCKMRRVVTEMTKAEIRYIYKFVMDLPNVSEGRADLFFGNVFGLFRDIGMVEDKDFEATYKETQTCAANITKSFFPDWNLKLQQHEKVAMESGEVEEDQVERVDIPSDEDIMDTGNNENDAVPGEEMNDLLPFNGVLPTELLDEASAMDLEKFDLDELTGCLDVLEGRPPSENRIAPIREEQEHVETIMNNEAPLLERPEEAPPTEQESMTMETLMKIFDECQSSYEDYAMNKYKEKTQLNEIPKSNEDADPDGNPE